MRNWRQKAKQVYRQRGYLVIARKEPYKIGAVIEFVKLGGKPNNRLPQAFRIVSETDYADYVTQHATATISLGEPREGFHFYRMMTD